MPQLKKSGEIPRRDALPKSSLPNTTQANGYFMQNYAKLGFWSILAIVALRVCIGWHFYKEGAAKIRGHDFSTVGFLQASKGPLAKNYQQLIWDNEGRFRLNKDSVNKVFENAVNASNSHFKFNEKQVAELATVKKTYIDKLNEVYDESQEDIYKYWESIGRLANMESSNMWNRVASLRGQKEKIEQDRMKSVQPVLAAVDAIWKQLEGRLNAIATVEQRRQAGWFSINRPGESLMSASVADQFVPYFDFVIGILLMVGLFTRLAAGAAAIFLLSVVLSQMPGYPGTQPTYFQAVECLALLFIAVVGAGRFAGLDFIFWARSANRRAAKQLATASK
ncbi:MAG: DoxX family membrane protein [Planctomycetales bacterium]|nr:DoxX family membrane protein [Planctomycetales bacterium]